MNVERANDLVLMHGKKMRAGVCKLYAKAASLEPPDATERLEVKGARAQLE